MTRRICQIGMENLKFFANKGPAICTLVYVLPILIPIVVIAFAWFYKPGKDALKEKVNSFLEDPEFVRWRGFFSMCLAIYTILEIIKAWTELGKLDLQSERPNRCLPFFDRVAAFQSNFANTSALYEYGQDSGTAKVRMRPNQRYSLPSTTSRICRRRRCTTPWSPCSTAPTRISA